MGKFTKRISRYEDNQDLTFTKEDRLETFKRIQRSPAPYHQRSTTLRRIGKRYVGPILGTLMVVLIMIGFLLPEFYQTNETKVPSSNQASEQKNTSFSALLIGKETVEDNSGRTSIHILLTYNSIDKSVKLVPIPSDAYVDINDPAGEMTQKDKLMHAYAYHSSPEAVLATVSTLFDMPIDYYSIFSEEEIYGMLGIKEDDRKNGPVQLYKMRDLLEERLSGSQINKILEVSETDIPDNILNHFQVDGSNAASVEIMDMEKGTEETFINGIYYVKINQDLLESTANKLKQHVGYRE